MESNANRPFLAVLILPLFLVFACSTPSWFPIKKGPPHKAKIKELVNQEVIIVDRREYVKVLNPRGAEGGDQPRFLYIPVEEYLAKREAYAVPTLRGEQEKRGSSASMGISPSSKPGAEVLSTSVSVSTAPHLKKKVLIAHFDDRTATAEEIFGDWLAERLMKEMTQKAFQVLFVDYQMVKEFLEKKENTTTDLDSPEVSKMLNEVFGVHAIVLGELSGPYVFTAKGPKDQDETSTAIIKIEMKIIDTFSGKILKTLSAQNPIVPTKERGSFSDEKAKGRAFSLTISELSRSLSKELDRLDWFCRVAKVDGDQVFINAGKLSGLRVGDVLDVLRPEKPGERGDIKGKIQISTTFGLDASIGRLIQGKKPDGEDILRLARREGS
jgi:hypothetical protein